MPLLWYAASLADLISVFMPHSSISADEARAATSRGHHLWSNGAFRASLPHGIVHKWEHVERYSGALLRRIDGLLQGGAAAFGEIFASTVCNQTAGCRCADLRETGHVQRNGFLYAWSHPLTRKEIKRLFKLARPENAAEGRGMNRWLHGIAADTPSRWPRAPRAPTAGGRATCRARAPGWALGGRAQAPAVDRAEVAVGFSWEFLRRYRPFRAQL